MDLKTRIDALESTTFCGRRFSRSQILQIADTVSMFPNLSRKELSRTLCDHLDWRTATGELKVDSALNLLDKFEALNICKAPPLKESKRGPNKIHLVASTSEPVQLATTLAQVEPISLKIVEETTTRHRFNALMAANHYLGYKNPFGAHMRYFVVDKDGRELGLLLYAASAWALKDRDDWIGWERKHRIKRLHLVVSNSRLLIFPSVKIPNLASKVLALAAAQLADDWQRRYGYRPVLIETFVDQEKFHGTCYQAANWLKLGETKGRGRFDEVNAHGKSIKDIYVMPLVPNFRDVLLRGAAAIKAENIAPDVKERLCKIHDNVLSFWTMIAPLIRVISEEFDNTWRIKRRVIDSMLLVLLIMRLVATRTKQSYGTTIDELWENCRKQGLPLPQKEPIAASSFGAARLKLDEQIFKTINSRVISQYENVFDCDEYRFLGHRLYAVDGSKLNLPRGLLQDGFNTPNESSHYPQGLLSSLYRLKAKIPTDFILTSDLNERHGALIHLAALAQNDIVVYDRGYFSYGMLDAHFESGIHAVFRLSTGTYKVIKNFMESGDLERIVIIEPKSKRRESKIRKSYPGIIIKPLRLRLIKYQIAGTNYYLGTTLIGELYTQESLKDLYHARWGIEELYKISKHLIAIEEFHAQSLRGVKQELFAHMALVTINRIFTNNIDEGHKADITKEMKPHSERITTNFKNSMAAVARNLECLLLDTTKNLHATVMSILGSLTRRCQKIRLNRSYARQSRKPRSKWQKSNVVLQKKVA